MATPTCRATMFRSIWAVLLQHPWWCAVALVMLILSLPLLPEAMVWIVRAALVVLVLALGRRLVDARRNSKPVVFGLVAVALSLALAYGLLELACFVYLKKNPVTGDPFVMTERQRKAAQAIVEGTEGYQIYSPTLAWTIGRSQVSKNGLYKSNAQGFRADREYTRERPAGKIRVLCFGDSFTHCDEVANHETWPHQAEMAHPDMEFLNFGVPGYSLTQAYLRYTEVEKDFEADYVIIGCMTEDTKRSVNVYYPFRYPNPADSPNASALPFAMLDDKGALVIHPPFIKSREEYAAFLTNPLPFLKAMAPLDMLLRPQPPTPLFALLADREESLEPVVDYWLASWSRVHRSEGKFRSLRHREATRNGERRRRIAEINRQLFHRCFLEVKKNGAKPLILWFPSPMNLDHHNQGKKREYADYFAFFEQEGLTAVDTLDWLEERHGQGAPLPIEGLLEDVHFSAEANAYIGNRIADLIRDMHAKAESN